VRVGDRRGGEAWGARPCRGRRPSARAPPGEARPLTEEKPAAASCGGQSFTAGTLVLLASGKTVSISQFKTGDTVLASDTRICKDQPESVTAVMVHRDTDLYDLKVKAVSGTEVIHTTAGHLFWDPTCTSGGPRASFQGRAPQGRQRRRRDR
jgi:hypothetical protein